MKKTAFIVLFLSILLTQNGRSDGYLGPMIGVALPSLSGLNPRVVLGLNFGAIPIPALGLGAYILTSTESIPEFESIRISLIGADLSYRISGTLSGLELGIKVGFAVGSGGTSPQVPGFVLTGGGSYTEWTVGPRISYDYWIDSGISMGIELNTNILMIPDEWGMTNLLASAKYWF